MQVGDKIYFKEEKRPYRIKAMSDRYLICTKPFNLQHTVIYTIVDLKENIRSTNNLVFNIYDYKDQNDIDQCLKDLEDPKHCCGLSRRNHIKLEIDYEKK